MKKARSQHRSTTTTISFRSILVLVGIVGLLFSGLAAASCGFVKLGDLTGLKDDARIGGFADKAGVFLYESQENETCEPYGRYLRFDPVLTGVGVAAILAPVFASLALIVQILDLTCCTTCCVENLITFGYFLAYVCQACTFSILGSNVCLTRYCEVAVGGGFAIVAIILFFVVSVAICFTPRPEPCLCKKIEEGANEKHQPAYNQGTTAAANEFTQPVSTTPNNVEEQSIPVQTH
mmetsp:Transcript_3903/g.6529  ORF Transcript_3903/g.6529 Transcript_3903/m.6529 type:complete len:236 (+) Transcript_3903:159-866(+)